MKYLLNCTILNLFRVINLMSFNSMNIRYDNSEEKKIQYIQQYGTYNIEIYICLHQLDVPLF
jgi:hypothetical protein